MLNPDNEEEESDSDSSDNKSKGEKKENEINNKKDEEKISNNLTGEYLKKQTELNDSSNFFKNDSNNYDIIESNKINPKNNNNKENLNNNKKNSDSSDSENEAETESSLTAFNPNDEWSYEKNEDKKQNNIENNKINNNINNSNHSKKLENKDNNNSSSSSNSNTNKNKDNNSETNEEGKKEKSVSNSLNSDNKEDKNINSNINNNINNNISINNNINNSLNNNVHNSLNNNNNINVSINNNVNNSINNNINNSINNKKSINKSIKKDSDNSSSSSKKSDSESSSEKQKESSSKKVSILDPYQNTNNNNNKEEENINNLNNNANNKDNNDSNKKENNNEIIENKENNNINNKKDNSSKSSSDQEEENEDEEKKDTMTITSEDDNKNNNNDIQKNDEDKKDDDKENINNNIDNNKKTNKIIKTDISSIKINSSLIKENIQQSFSLDKSNSEKKQKQENDKKSHTSESSESSDSSEESKNKKKSEKIEENEITDLMKNLETKDIKIESKQTNKKISKKLETSHEINYIKDEYYINYIKLMRKGFKELLEKNYTNGYNIFLESYELSSKHLKNKVKQIDSLINMSICQYYNGNFKNSVYLLDNAKKIFSSLSLGECHIAPREKIKLGIKLYANSSMTNLSVNNYKESINDIKFIINLIETENDFYKKLSLFKSVLNYLFKVETLLNIKNENEIMTDINNNFNFNISDKNLINLNEEQKSEINNIQIENQNEKMIHDFLACLKYKKYLIILNSFVENASIYKKEKNLTGYYFCIFNQYLITYNMAINDDKELQDKNITNEEIKERLYICYKNLLGEKISSDIKEKKLNKDITTFLSEFNDKMECSYEIFSMLEEYEKSINKVTKDFYKSKKGPDILTKKKKNIKLQLNEESPYLVKLCLKYSLNHLRKKRDMLINLNNENKDNILENKDSQEPLNNINALIKELEILLSKIATYEIDITSIKKNKINEDIIKNINILLENLTYIYYKSLLYRRFHKLQEKILKIQLTENSENIDTFLENHYNSIIKGMELIKVNYRTKGHKIYFYNIDEDSTTLNVREIQDELYPTKSYNLFKDVTKLTYGLRSNNLINKIKNKNEVNPETRQLLLTPWRFISFVLKKKSVDLYCEDDQVDSWFYGFKYFTNNNNVEYKIISTNKYLLNKIKYRIAMKLKIAIDRKHIKEKRSISIILKIIKEKAFHNISFTKLILLYNKYMKE